MKTGLHHKEEIALVLDYALPYALILFIVGGYGVVKLGGWFWRAGPQSPNSP